MTVLFGDTAANVQPHAGAQANAAVMAALLTPSDTILSLDPTAATSRTACG